ncbi:MAG: single-stranded-DNA-specific exonuclease RecJ [Spirochaetota bacterium]
MSKLLHGIAFSDLPKKSNGLTNLQSYILQKILPPEQNAETFLHGKLEDLPSPFLLPMMEEAVESMAKFIREKKHILLYGDRDTDGVSSTSLLAIFLRKKHESRGGQLTVQTSSANDDYGLCEKAVSFIRSKKPDLLITLDFGSTNYDEINTLAQEGMKVIVLDHHVVPERIPNCFLVNPKREDSEYPESKICTSVIAMKLILAYEIMRIVKKGLPPADKSPLGLKVNYQKLDLHSFFRENPTLLQIQKDLLDLSSIGTITDMMPLQGENRIIVRNGLETLIRLNNETREERKGLTNLITGLKLNSNKITSKDLGWSIGPVLNAAGRMGRTEVSLELLLETDSTKAGSCAQKLIGINEERKERTKRNIDRVDRYFLRKPERSSKKIIFCYEPDMEPGVSGIVATRLVQKYKKPTVFVTPDHGNARGSVRSYQKENVITLLTMLSDLFHHFGGHPEAGGFSIELHRIPELEKRLPEVAEKWLSEAPREEEKLESLVSFQGKELNEKVFRELSLFEPFGQGNPQPTLSIKQARILSYRPMSGGIHGKFSILGVSSRIKGVIWNRGKEFEALLSLKAEIDLWGQLEENYFNGSTTIQFSVQDFV